MFRLFSLGFFCVLSACATAFETPRNASDFELVGYQAERQPMAARDETDPFERASLQNAARCADTDYAMAGWSGHIPANETSPTVLSPGDLLRVDIPRGEGFSGDYIVASDGYVRLPYVSDVPAAGFSRDALEHAIARLLVAGGFYQPSFARVSVSVLQWAPIQVQVSGAVFQTGDAVLNQRGAEDDPTARLDASGDHSVRRTLSAALYAAGGIRPDADVRNIVLIRGEQRRVFDMSGSLTGGRIIDPILVAGDRVHVPSRGCFQLALARPSRITPPGVRVFLSNLTQPAASNANSAIGQHATSLPYGTRMLQGLVSANCVGGIQATNANRWAVLISRNPMTGESEVIARSIERLVRRADRDDFNPVLLPGDAIACYDSHTTNLRDVVSMVGAATSPIVSTLVLGGLTE